MNEAIIRTLCENFKSFESEKQEVQNAYELETKMLRFLFSLGAKMINQLFQQEGNGYCGNVIQVNEQNYQFKGNRKKVLHGLFGLVEYSRAYYVNQNGGEGYYPLDKRLGIIKKHTPAVQYFLSQFTSTDAYNESLNRFHEIFRPNGTDYISLKKAIDMDIDLGKNLAQLRESEMEKVYRGEKIQVQDEIKRMAIAIDATKVREVQEEVKNDKKVKIINYRDAKIASVSEIKWDKKNEVAFCSQTSYTSAIEHADDFFKRIATEMSRRSKDPDQIELVFLGDGAVWIWDRVDDISNGKTIKILDYYHACEHLGSLCKVLFKEGTKEFIDQYRAWRAEMYEGKINQLIKKFKKIRDSAKGAVRTEIQKQIDYFETNKDRMLYDKYRQLKLPIGSGTIESACKNVIGGRMKKSGMAWSIEGAQGMLQIRASIKSGRFLQDFKQVYGFAA
jgi:hypothetical protein